MVKFDVVVGNPPYSVGGNREFFSKFVDRFNQFSKSSIWLTPSTRFTNPKNFNGVSTFKYLGNCFDGIDLSCCWYLHRTSDQLEMIAKTNERIVVKDPKHYITSDLRSYEFFMKYKSKGEGINSNANGRRSLYRNYLTCVDESTPGAFKAIRSFGSYEGDFNWVWVHPDQRKQMNGLGVHKIVFATKYVFDGSKTKIRYAGPEFSVCGNCMFIELESELEAESLIGYLRTRFVHTIVKAISGERNSITQGILSQIPKVPLDRTWTNEMVYKHFNLTPEEIDYLESL